jgi:hypothetical protein
MTAIWRNDGKGWTLLNPSGFLYEKTLQDRIEEAPQLLPLSGNPHLIIVGREVYLKGKYADFIAIESSGRLAIIEVKLTKNTEAKREVVAQILMYAAYLQANSLETLEQEVFKDYLQLKNVTSLLELVQSEVQYEGFDVVAFQENLRTSLANGHFRLVFVLDQAPDELVELVRYLGNVTNEELLIDLITISSYEIGGETILIPQRIDPERLPVAEIKKPKPTVGGRVVQGGEDFEKSIFLAPEEAQPIIRRLYHWAHQLEVQETAYLKTYYSRRTERNEMTLLPYIPGHEKGLVTIYLDKKGTYLQFWRSVFVKHAPLALVTVESIIAPAQIGQGNTLQGDKIEQLGDKLLDALTLAYREASHQLPG